MSKWAQWGCRVTSLFLVVLAWALAYVSKQVEGQVDWVIVGIVVLGSLGWWVLGYISEPA